MLRCYRCGSRACAGLGHMHGTGLTLCLNCSESAFLNQIARLCMLEMNEIGIKHIEKKEQAKAFVKDDLASVVYGLNYDAGRSYEDLNQLQINEDED